MLERNILANLENLDYCQLADSDEYAQYHRHLLRVLKLFVGYHERLKDEDHLSDAELTQITHWFKSLLNAINLLRLKYQYNHISQLQIDLSESGFPNYDELENLSVDIQYCSEQLRKARPVKDVKDELLDFLCANKAAPKRLLGELGQIRYYQKLQTEKNIFNTFMQGQFMELSRKQTHINYLISWMYYDMATNRPNICLMSFEYHNKGLPIIANPEHLNTFWASVSQKNRRTVNMRLMAEQIDYELEFVHPMQIKRLDIGPLFNNYSKDSHPITQFFKTNKFEKNDFILTFTMEVIKSQGYFEKTIEVSKGIFFRETKKIVYQDFKVPERKAETYINEVSSFNRYMLLPHTIAQHLYDSEHQKFIKELSIPPITFIN